MSTRSLTKAPFTPSLFNEFFKPWNEWFDDSSLINRMITQPAVNIIEDNNQYMVSLAVPGFKKEDFIIDMDGNMLTINSEKEDASEEEDKRFTRKEYSYLSFSRSFTLPEEINREKIEAKYEDGVLKILLPRREAAKALTSKQINIK